MPDGVVCGYIDYSAHTWMLRRGRSVELREKLVFLLDITDADNKWLTIDTRTGEVVARYKTEEER